MVLGLPGGGRGEHRRPLPHASCRLSPCAPYGPFHSATSHSRSRITTALTELPTSSRVAGVDSTLRPCSPQPEGARGAAKPSQEGAARGPSGACRAAARRVGMSEDGPVVLRHVQPWTRTAGTASSKLGVDGPGHERAFPGRFPLEPAPLRRTGGLLSLSC